MRSNLFSMYKVMHLEHAGKFAYKNFFWYIHVYWFNKGIVKIAFKYMY